MNEIITFGQNYKLIPGIKVFCESTKDKADRVTIIGIDLQPEVTQYLETQEHINLVDGRQIAKKYNVNLQISPYTLKVIFYYLYCKHLSNAENVFVCDFTDMFFQKSPFELIKNSKPYVTSENYLIQDCNTNSTWINLCYNADIHNMLKSKEILNGGNIFGNKVTVIDFLKDLCDDLKQIISRIGNYPNPDQAAINKLVYFDQHRYNILNGFEIINFAHHGTAKVDLQDTVKVNGKVPFIIHQYDVIKSLENFLYDKHNQ
tara:strand:+ start:944 stop:1723 length:780 start_codon:yes stop_codon:yes gene_type:complete